MEKFYTEEEEEEKVVTILSIDGGGVKGIIPGTILEFLESELKRLNGDYYNDVRICDYFDMIAGTSTGGLVAAMLATPKPEDSTQPIMAANEICNFYKTECPNIFGGNKGRRSRKRKRNQFQEALDNIKLITEIWSHPMYDGKYLRHLVKEKAGERRLGETLTNVLIPSYDIKRLQPTIFSTLRAKDKDSEDAPMSDVCIATSAAPIYLPPHHFKTKTKEFNLADGALAANNPTLLAMAEMKKKIGHQTPTKFLALSLGTGAVKRDEKLDVKDKKWGVVDWLSGPNGTNPLLDIFTTAMDNMADIYTSMLFQDSSCKRN